MVDQLRSLFKFQRQLTSGLAGLDILGLTKNLFDQDAITGVIREDELTEIANQIGKRFGLDGKIDGKNLADEYIENFSTNKNL